MKPLEGIKVVEFSFWLAGPSAGAILGEWGADVIRVEDLKAGDPARGWLETGILPPARFNYLYEPYNRNKRNLALDTRQPQGKDIVYQLVKRADVFLTNVRRPVLAKIGLDHNTLSQLNPQLIYACNTGLGTRGPDKDKMFFDELAWARSGIMSCLGEPDAPPPPQIIAWGDLTTGMYLASAVLLGLQARQRTGKGMEVNTSLLHTGVWTAGWNIEASLAMGKDFQRITRYKPGNPLWNTYHTKDNGWIQISLYNSDPYWVDFCRAIGREDLINDPRIDTHEKRLKNNMLLFSILDEVFVSRTTEEWKARFRQYDFAWEAMQTCLQVVEDPQVKENDYLVDLEHPKLGKIKVPSVPIQINQTSFRPYRAAPEQGQDNEEVLRELGYSQAGIEKLRQAKIIL